MIKLEQIVSQLKAFMNQCEEDADYHEKNYNDAFLNGMTLGRIVWGLLGECKMDGKALQRILKVAGVPNISFMDSFLFSGFDDDDDEWVAIKSEIAKIKKESERT